MFDRDLNALSKLLSVSAMRHQAHAQNIANLNTPGFKKKSVVFESLLDSERMKESILATQPKVVAKEAGSRIDSNSVSLEEEIQGLTANNLMYQIYLQTLSKKIQGLEGAILGHF